MLTRRALLKQAVAASPALALAAFPAGATARRARRARLPAARELAREVREMVALGPRLTATSAHRQFVDGLEDGFRAAGLSVGRDPQPFSQWLAQRWSLEVLEGPGAGRVPVASYYT